MPRQSQHKLRYQTPPASASHAGDARPTAVPKLPGKIKFYRPSNADGNEGGWGFISPDDGSPDVFVHRSGLLPQFKDITPVEDQRVMYRPGPGRNNKPAAFDVELLPLGARNA